MGEKKTNTKTSVNIIIIIRILLKMYLQHFKTYIILYPLKDSHVPQGFLIELNPKLTYSNLALPT